MISLPQFDDRLADEEEGPVAASLRRARETLESAEATSEPPEVQERRRMYNRDLEIAAEIQQRQAHNYQERKAPIFKGDYEAREQANALARVAEAPAPKKKPYTSAEVISAVGIRFGELRRYTENLEKALGKMMGERDKRAAASEQRTAGIEARLATIEQRIAALEAKPVTVIEHEKKLGQ